MQVRVVLPLLLVLAAVPSTPAAAHGEHEAECDRRADAWNHLELWDVELAPGEAANRTLAFEGCPMQEGWRVLLRGDAEGVASLSLRQSGEELGAWSWNGPERFEVVTLPHGDFLTLHVANEGAGNASVRLYFDQTCLCPVKGTHLVPGPVWMNALAEAGDQVSFNVSIVPSSYPPREELPETIHVRAVLPGHPEATQRWSFRPATDPACRDGARWTGCLEYSFQAPSDGRQDVLLWLDHDGGEGWSLAVRPVIEVEGEDGRGAPGLPAVAALCVLALAAALRRRRP